jgi:hypothetical protein
MSLAGKEELSLGVTVLVWLDQALVDCVPFEPEVSVVVVELGVLVLETGRDVVVSKLIIINLSFLFACFFFFLLSFPFFSFFFLPYFSLFSPCLSFFLSFCPNFFFLSFLLTFCLSFFSVLIFSMPDSDFFRHLHTLTQLSQWRYSMHFRPYSFPTVTCLSHWAICNNYNLV